MSRFYPVEPPPRESYRIVRVPGGRYSGERKGAVFHAVMVDNKERGIGRALCKSIPSRPWHAEEGTEVTCKDCAVKLGLLRSRTEWDPVVAKSEKRVSEDGRGERNLMQRPAIPVLEPEVIEAEARKRHGDYDKVPTTSRGSVIYRGVDISSRYSVHYEMEAMLTMVEKVPEALIHRLKKLDCDSKQGHSYGAIISPWDVDVARMIGKALEEGVMEVDGWHNGIYLRGEEAYSGDHVEIEADYSGIGDEDADEV